MASGLPVIASDLAVHQEICGDAGGSISRGFLRRHWRKPGTSCSFAGNVETHGSVGVERARQFSWKTHVEKILELSRTLVDSMRPAPMSDIEG